MSPPLALPLRRRACSRSRWLPGAAWCGLIYLLAACCLHVESGSSSNVASDAGIFFTAASAAPAYRAHGGAAVHPAAGATPHPSPTVTTTTTTATSGRHAHSQLDTTGVASSSLSSSVSLTPSRIDFGSTQTLVPLSASVEVRNPSATTHLDVLSIESQSAHFHVHGFEAVSLPPGAHVNVQVMFLPCACGTIIGRVSVRVRARVPVAVSDDSAPLGIVLVDDLLVMGSSVRNEYGLHPLTDLFVSVDSLLFEPIAIDNAHATESLFIHEVFTTESYLQLGLPDENEGATTRRRNNARSSTNGAATIVAASRSTAVASVSATSATPAAASTESLEVWEVPPSTNQKRVLHLIFATHGRAAGSYGGYIHIQTSRHFLILPVQVTVLAEPVRILPSEIDFGVMRHTGRARGGMGGSDDGAADSSTTTTRVVSLENLSGHWVAIERIFAHHQDPNARLDDIASKRITWSVASHTVKGEGGVLLLAPRSTVSSALSVTFSSHGWSSHAPANSGDQPWILALRTNRTWDARGGGFEHEGEHNGVASPPLVRDLALPIRVHLQSTAGIGVNNSEGRFNLYAKTTKKKKGKEGASVRDDTTPWSDSSRAIHLHTLEESSAPACVRISSISLATPDPNFTIRRIFNGTWSTRDSERIVACRLAFQVRSTSHARPSTNQLRLVLHITTPTTDDGSCRTTTSQTTMPFAVESLVLPIELYDRHLTARLWEQTTRALSGPQPSSELDVHAVPLQWQSNVLRRTGLLSLGSQSTGEARTYFLTLHNPNPLAIRVPSPDLSAFFGSARRLDGDDESNTTTAAELRDDVPIAQRQHDSVRLCRGVIRFRARTNDTREESTSDASKLAGTSDRLMSLTELITALDLGQHFDWDDVGTSKAPVEADEPAANSTGSIADRDLLHTYLYDDINHGRYLEALSMLGGEVLCEEESAEIVDEKATAGGTAVSPEATKTSLLASGQTIIYRIEVTVPPLATLARMRQRAMKQQGSSVPSSSGRMSVSSLISFGASSSRSSNSLALSIEYTAVSGYVELSLPSAVAPAPSTASHAAWSAQHPGAHWLGELYPGKIIQVPLFAISHFPSPVRIDPSRVALSLPASREAGQFLLSTLVQDELDDDLADDTRPSKQLRMLTKRRRTFALTMREEEVTLRPKVRQLIGVITIRVPLPALEPHTRGMRPTDDLPWRASQLQSPLSYLDCLTYDWTKELLPVARGIVQTTTASFAQSIAAAALLSPQTLAPVSPHLMLAFFPHVPTIFHGLLALPVADVTALEKSYALWRKLLERTSGVASSSSRGSGAAASRTARREEAFFEQALVIDNAPPSSRGLANETTDTASAAAASGQTSEQEEAQLFFQPMKLDFTGAFVTRPTVIAGYYDERTGHSSVDTDAARAPTPLPPSSTGASSSVGGGSGVISDPRIIDFDLVEIGRHREMTLHFLHPYEFTLAPPTSERQRYGNVAYGEDDDDEKKANEDGASESPLDDDSIRARPIFIESLPLMSEYSFEQSTHDAIDLLDVAAGKTSLKAPKLNQKHNPFTVEHIPQPQPSSPSETDHSLARTVCVLPFRNERAAAQSTSPSSPPPHGFYRVTFSPIAAGRFQTLLVLRTNLTRVEVVLLRGTASRGSLAFHWTRHDILTEYEETFQRLVDAHGLTSHSQRSSASGAHSAVDIGDEDVSVDRASAREDHIKFMSQVPHVELGVVLGNKATMPAAAMAAAGAKSAASGGTTGAPHYPRLMLDVDEYFRAYYLLHHESDLSAYLEVASDRSRLLVREEVPPVALLADSDLDADGTLLIDAFSAVSALPFENVAVENNGAIGFYVVAVSIGPQMTTSQFRTRAQVSAGSKAVGEKLPSTGGRYTLPAKHWNACDHFLRESGGGAAASPSSLLREFAFHHCGELPLYLAPGEFRWFRLTYPLLAQLLPEIGESYRHARDASSTPSWAQSQSQQPLFMHLHTTTGIFSIGLEMKLPKVWRDQIQLATPSQARAATTRKTTKTDQTRTPSRFSGGGGGGGGGGTSSAILSFLFYLVSFLVFIAAAYHSDTIYHRYAVPAYIYLVSTKPRKHHRGGHACCGLGALAQSLVQSCLRARQSWRRWRAQRQVATEVDDDSNEAGSDDDSHDDDATPSPAAVATKHAGKKAKKKHAQVAAAAAAAATVVLPTPAIKKSPTALLELTVPKPETLNQTPSPDVAEAQATPNASSLLASPAVESSEDGAALTPAKKKKEKEKRKKVTALAPDVAGATTTPPSPPSHVLLPTAPPSIADTRAALTALSSRLGSGLHKSKESETRKSLPLVFPRAHSTPARGSDENEPTVTPTPEHKPAESVINALTRSTSHTNKEQQRLAPTAAVASSASNGSPVSPVRARTAVSTANSSPVRPSTNGTQGGAVNVWSVRAQQQQQQQQQQKQQERQEKQKQASLKKKAQNGLAKRHGATAGMTSASSADSTANSSMHHHDRLSSSMSVVMESTPSIDDSFLADHQLHRSSSAPFTHTTPPSHTSDSFVHAAAHDEHAAYAPYSTSQHVTMGNLQPTLTHASHYQAVNDESLLLHHQQQQQQQPFYHHMPDRSMSDHSAAQLRQLQVVALLQQQQLLRLQQQQQQQEQQRLQHSHQHSSVYDHSYQDQGHVFHSQTYRASSPSFDDGLLDLIATMPLVGQPESTAHDMHHAASSYAHYAPSHLLVDGGATSPSVASEADSSSLFFSAVGFQPALSPPVGHSSATISPAAHHASISSAGDFYDVDSYDKEEEEEDLVLLSQLSNTPAVQSRTRLHTPSHEFESGLLATPPLPSFLARGTSEESDIGPGDEQ